MLTIGLWSLPPLCLMRSTWWALMSTVPCRVGTQSTWDSTHPALRAVLHQSQGTWRRRLRRVCSKSEIWLRSMNNLGHLPYQMTSAQFPSTSIWTQLRTMMQALMDAHTSIKLVIRERTTLLSGNNMTDGEKRSRFPFMNQSMSQKKRRSTMTSTVSRSSLTQLWLKASKVSCKKMNTSLENNGISQMSSKEHGSQMTGTIMHATSWSLAFSESHSTWWSRSSQV